MVGALVGGVTGLLGANLVWGVIAGLDLVAEHFIHAVLIVFLIYIGIVVGARRAGVVRARPHHRRLQGRLAPPPVQGARHLGDHRRPHRRHLRDELPRRDARRAAVRAARAAAGGRFLGLDEEEPRPARPRRTLQRVQKMANVQVQIVETDFPEVKEVDLKLIELAKRLSGKIVTNDFNLNKVAQLQGVAVLNINELANAVKPVVLPGEELRVFVLKEGKEPEQGVAYLDDGTMVVVDQGGAHRPDDRGRGNERPPDRGRQDDLLPVAGGDSRRAGRGRAPPGRALTREARRPPRPTGRPREPRRAPPRVRPAGGGRTPPRGRGPSRPERRPRAGVGDAGRDQRTVSPGVAGKRWRRRWSSSSSRPRSPWP